jgi:hypothetical protein
VSAPEGPASSSGHSAEDLGAVREEAPKADRCHRCDREAVMYLTVTTSTRFLCEHHALEMLNRWRLRNRVPDAPT